MNQSLRQLVPIVEGQSEERSIGGFLRRILDAEGRYDLTVARPVRVKRNQVVRDGELERALSLALRARSNAAGILVLLDADDDCPATLGPELLERARKASHAPVAVVLANVETESWILAGIESVRGLRGIRADAVPPRSVDDVRDAKRALTSRMTGSRGYVATADQPALLAGLDLDLAANRSSSLRKLRRDVVNVLQAMGEPRAPVRPP